jgi:Phosphoheptose isomerase
MKKNLFISDYIQKFCKVITSSESQKKKIISIYDILKKLNSSNTVHVFGNGGSASIASHFSMDLTNNSNIRCLNFNDPSIITCYSNDYKFENWISRAISKYGKKKDILILISSSGKSKNMINAIKSAKLKKFSKIISFTGFSKKNYMNQNSDICFWINSKDYNIIENSHQFYLLMIVDMIKNSSK